MPKSKSDYVHIPWLDNLLTVSTIAIGVVSLWTFRSRPDELTQFVVSFVSTYFLIQGSKMFFSKLFLYIGSARSLEKPRNRRKFADQGWQLVIHVVMSCLEWYLLHRDNWELWDQPFEKTFDGTSHDDALLKFLYLFQLGVWLYTAVSHRFFELRHKDYYIMYFHHVVTMILILGSYVTGLQKIGLLVLFCHDLPDVVADLLKMTNYMGADMSAGFPLVEVAFVSTIVSWFVFRLMYYPQKAIAAAIWHTGSNSCELPGVVYMMDDHWTESIWKLALNGNQACNAMRLLLVSLLVLHWWWFFLFLRIAYRLIVGENAHSAGADEYEGASSDSALDSDGQLKKHQ